MSLATLGLASKLCGSVLGLLSTAVAWTYLPPIWLITLAYWFSAPTATMTLALSVLAAGAGPGEQAVTSTVTASAATASAAIAGRDVAGTARSGAASPRPRRGGMTHIPFTVVAASRRCTVLTAARLAAADAGVRTAVTNENHNHYGNERQAEPAPRGHSRGWLFPRTWPEPIMDTGGASRIQLPRSS